MLWADTETRSRLDLMEVGAHRYSRHSSTEVTLFPFAFDDDEPECVEVDNRDLKAALKSDARELYDYLVDGDGKVCFHNSQFDRWVLEAQGIAIDTRRIVDTMVIAYTMSLPGSLAKLGSALKLDDDSSKNIEGKKLIQMFCKPCPGNVKLREWYDRNTHPEGWVKFVEYAKSDIIAMRECHRRMPTWNFNENERKIWLMDQKINDLGAKVDKTLVKNAIALSEAAQEDVKMEISETTKGYVTSYTQAGAIQRFCEARGLTLDNARKETLESLLIKGEVKDETVKRVLELRLEGNLAALSKYKAARARTSREDSRFRGGLQYGGASRTLRFAGRGLQLQNLARPTYGLDQDQAAAVLLADTNPAEWSLVKAVYDNPLDVVKSLVRGVFIPKEGCLFAVSDLSNIEGRITAWVAGEDWKVKAFRDYDEGNGPDIYLKTYSESFGVPIENVTKDDRQIGKVQELAGGYQGWIGAWTTFSEAYQIEPKPESEIIQIMGGWRDAHPRIREFWGRLQETFSHALNNPNKGWRCGDHISMRYYPDYKGMNLLLVKLPSGRYIPYLDPAMRFDPRRKKRGLSYKGLDDRSMWAVQFTYGGKLLENIVQAIARDLLCESMLRIQEVYDIVLHVHDEVLCEVPAAEAEGALDFIDEALKTTPSWAPGLPLNAAGEVISRYKKV